MKWEQSQIKPFRGQGLRARGKCTLCRMFAWVTGDPTTCNLAGSDRGVLPAKFFKQYYREAPLFLRIAGAITSVTTT